MRITLGLTWNEQRAVRLLNWLARENADQYATNPDLPGVYDSGAVYRREKTELWLDATELVKQGHEDCDGLAAARAGELLARGGRALLPSDHGYKAAQRLDSIPAQVMLTTPDSPGAKSRLYHCIVRYQVGKTWYRDDPSLRLGMRRGMVDKAVLRRWSELGIVPAVLAGADQTNARARALGACCPSCSRGRACTGRGR
jgi:hypothetical protein